MLDTLHLAMITHAVYYYGVTNFGNVETMYYPVWYVLRHSWFLGFHDLVAYCEPRRTIWVDMDL